MSTSKKALAAVFFVLFCIASVRSVFAEEYMMIEDFESENHGLFWSADSGCSAETYSMTGESYLGLKAPAATSDRIITAVGTFDEARDWSAFRTFEMKIRVSDIPAEESKICYAKITLFSDDLSSCESITSVRAGEWAEITLDISDFGGRNAVRAIEVGVIPDRISSGVWDGGFCIDDILVRGSADADKTERFMFDEYECDGASVHFSEDERSFDVEPDGEFESAVFMFTPEAYIAPYANALRIKLENRTESEFIKVFLTYSDGGLKETELRIEPQSDAKVYYLHVDNAAKIVGVTLEFENKKGSYVISSISAASVYEKSVGTVYGKIETCIYDEKNGVLTVSGTVPREYVSENSNSKLLLFALELNEDVEKYDFTYDNALAEHGMSTKFKFVFNVGYSPEAVYKKYVVTTDDRIPKLIDTPDYANFAENESKDYTDFHVGLISDSDAAVGSAFAEATVVDVELDQLISTERSGYIHENVGGYYYFDRNYTDMLDRRIAALSDSGVDIMLRLVLGSDRLAELMYSGTVGSIVNGYMLNIHNEQGYGLLRASVGFLSSRYKANSGKAGVCGYIVGSSVNALPEQNSAPLMSITEHSESYADTLRLVSTASKAAGFPVCVYASLGDVYEYDLLVPNENIYDSTLYMNALRTYIEDEGTFNYGICLEEVDSSWRYGSAPSVMDSTDFFMPAVAMSGSVIIIDDVSATSLDFEPETRNSAARAEKNGFSGRYIYRIKTEDNTEKKLIIQKLALGAKKERTIKPALFKNDNYLTGRYLYCDFGSYEGLGNWRVSYNATEVSVKNAKLYGKLERIGNDTTEPMGIGCSFGYLNDFSLTPLVSFELLVQSEELTGKNVDITVRFIGDGVVFDSTAELIYGEKQTLYIDFSGVEVNNGFSSVQVLLNDDKASEAEIFADNIYGYSDKYNDDELSEKVTLLRLGGSGYQNNDMTVVLIFISLLAVLITATIMLVLFRKRIND